MQERVMKRFATFIAAAGLMAFAGNAQPVPPRLPDGALVHDLSEDQVVSTSFPNKKTMVVDVIFFVHYGGSLTGLATYEGQYTINLVDSSFCLAGVGTFSGTFNGEPLETSLELFGDGMCGNLATGLVAGAAKLGDSATVFIKCGRNPLHPNEGVCTYEIAGKI